MIEPILISLILIVLVHLPFYIMAMISKTDYFTDLSYGLSFVLTTIILYVFTPLRTNHKLLLVLMTGWWGVRLALYLFIRVIKTKKDARFDKIRQSFTKFSSFWLLQVISVWIILLPITIAISKNENIMIGPVILAGVLVWIAGYLIETIADYQKFSFKSKNPTKFVSDGLWKYSRHPNYFGEILCWVGVFLVAYPALSGLEVLSVISPIFITVLLLFVSGIPPTEKQQDKKYGLRREYKEYKRRTSVLIPMPQRK